MQKELKILLWVLLVIENVFCNINKSFYTRGEQCNQHSWTLVGCNLQISCGDQYHYTSLTEIDPILYPSLSIKKL